MKLLVTLMLVVLMQLCIIAQTFPYNQEFQVNTYTYADQSNIQIAVLKSGVQVVCWDSWEHLGSLRGVYAQMYDTSGTRIGDEIHVNTYQEHEQIKPKISALTNDGFVVCWQSYHQDSLGYGDLGWGVFAQIFDGNGIKIGEEIQVNTTKYGGQIFPEIVTLSLGGFAICWETFIASYNSDTGVFIQFFNSDGSRRGSELLVNTTQLEGYGVITPMLTEITSGNVVVCWANHSNNYNINGIYAQMFDQNGLKIGLEIKVTTDTIYSHWYPELLAMPYGGFVIASDNDLPQSGILVNKFDSMGNRIGEQSIIFSDFIADKQKIACFSDGRFIITWQNCDFTFDFDVFAQFYDANNNKIGDSIRVNTYTANSQEDPQILVLTPDNFIISWTSAGQDGSGSGVYAQMYDLSGYNVGEEFRVNSYILHSQRSPVISSLSEMGFMILWQSYGQDGSGYGIYGKYLLNEPIEHQLTEFSLLLPQNNETIYITNPMFVWENATEVKICFPWEIKYDLYISETQNFNDPIITSGILDTTARPISLIPGNTYYWRVTARNIAGDSLLCIGDYQLYVDPSAVLESEEFTNQMTNVFNLSQNYPNPFNPSTSIQYAISSRQFVTLKVYDVLGNEIATLVNEEKPAGNYEVNFDGTGLTTGIYFYKLRTGSFVETKKMLLLK